MRNPKIVLSGLATLVAVLASAIGGLAIGMALAKFSGETTTATSEKRASKQRRQAAHAVRVRVVSAILHPASSSSGKRRQRARLSVHVRVTNSGNRRVVPARPVLVSGDVRLKTDPSQDTAATHLRALAPGTTGDVTLRFETAGTLTQRLQQELRAPVIIADRNLTARVEVGTPVRRRAGS